MVGVVLFAMVMAGVYSGLIQAYNLQALSRYRDNARAVIRSYVDQFQRLATTADQGGTVYSRWLFSPTGDFTGDGLVTTGLCVDDNFSLPDPGPPGNGTPTPPIDIILGEGSYALKAQLSRDIDYVDPATGETSNNQVIGAAGYLIRGVFRVRFTFNQKVYDEEITVLRTVK